MMVTVDFRFLVKFVVGFLLILSMLCVIVFTNGLHYELHNKDENPMMSLNVFLFVVIFVLMIIDLFCYFKTKVVSSCMYVRNVVYFLLLVTITFFSVTRVFVDSFIIQ